MKIEVSNSKRKIDADTGFMTIEDCVLTEEGIHEYLGSELPEELEIDENKIYKIFRSKKLLEDSVDTFNNLPLFYEHIPINSNNYSPELIIGSVGENSFLQEVDGKTQLLTNLIVYNEEIINRIQSGELKYLSAGYTREFKKSNSPDYDFELTKINGNHVAIVEDPRIKSAVIADSNKNFINGVKNMLNLFTGEHRKKFSLDNETIQKAENLQNSLVELKEFLKSKGLENVIEFEIKEGFDSEENLLKDESKEKAHIDEGAGFREFDRKNENVQKKETESQRKEDEGTGFRDFYNKDEDLESIMRRVLSEILDERFNKHEKEEMEYRESIQDSDEIVGGFVDKNLCQDADSVYSHILMSKGIDCKNMSYDSKKGIVKGMKLARISNFSSSPQYNTNISQDSNPNSSSISKYIKKNKVGY